MEYPNNDSNDVSPVDPKLPVWEKIKGPLSKIVLVLIVLVVLLLLFLSAKTARNTDDQKLSQEFRKDLIARGSMADSTLFAGAGEMLAGDVGTTVAPEEKVTPDEEKPPVIVPQENKEEKPAEEIVENTAKAPAPIVRKGTTKTTAVAKPPVIPKKKTSKTISCKDEIDGKDHPKKSTIKGKHMDEDCCPDPDEWPKPGCVYSEKGLDLMLSGPPKKKK